MIVDLPAPFSPTTAWISPGEIPNDTSLTAVMPPKRFVTACSRMMSVVVVDSVMIMLVGSEDPARMPVRAGYLAIRYGAGVARAIPGCRRSSYGRAAA